MAARVKKGDTVEIIAGKDKDQRVEVIQVLPKAGRIVVSGKNLVKKHEKARQTGAHQIPAQILETENPLNISNVMLVCPTCKETTRVGILIRDDGYKTRVCKKCNAEID